MHNPANEILLIHCKEIPFVSGYRKYNMVNMSDQFDPRIGLDLVESRYLCISTNLVRSFFYYQYHLAILCYWTLCDFRTVLVGYDRVKILKYFCNFLRIGSGLIFYGSRWACKEKLDRHATLVNTCTCTVVMCTT